MVRKTRLTLRHKVVFVTLTASFLVVCTHTLRVERSVCTWYQGNPELTLCVQVSTSTTLKVLTSSSPDLIYTREDSHPERTDVSNTRYLDQERGWATKVVGTERCTPRSGAETDVILVIRTRLSDAYNPQKTHKGKRVPIAGRMSINGS